MQKVLLIGIAGTYNYGCEAQVRGTVNILRQYNPSLEIHYASYQYADDVRRLAGCPVTILKRDRMDWSWMAWRILRKMLSLVGIPLIIPYDTIYWIVQGGYDTIFSIGGDIYTLPPGKSFRAPLASLCDACVRRGLQYVLWGASVGPFDHNQAALTYYKQHLCRVDLIVARESHTVEYLRKIGIEDNVVLAPDPAFFAVNGADIVSAEKLEPATVGINLSPLSSVFEYTSVDKGMTIQSAAISAFLEKTDYRVVLLSHVRSPRPDDNDYLYLKGLKNQIPEKFQHRVELLEEDAGFIGLQRYLRKLSFVIAARMHCALNAISAGVPVIFLAYSEKARGMVQYVYQSSEPMLGLSEFADMDKIIGLIQNWNQVSEFQKIKRFDFGTVLRQLR